MNTFITDHYAAFLTVHLLSMAIGLGGATISDILFFKFLKDFKVSPKEAEVLDTLKNVILTAIVFIAISGICLLLGKPSLVYSAPFLTKAFIAIVLIVNGICLHHFIAPYLIDLNLKHSPSLNRNWYRLAFALGAISVISWYSVFLIAGLKSYLPQNLTLLLTAYTAILFTGILCSQLFESVVRAKANR